MGREGTRKKAEENERDKPIRVWRSGWMGRK